MIENEEVKQVLYQKIQQQQTQRNVERLKGFSNENG